MYEYNGISNCNIMVLLSTVYVYSSLVSFTLLEVESLICSDGV